jgi:hypothetical protein
MNSEFIFLSSFLGADLFFVSTSSTNIKEEKVKEPQKPQKFFKRERENET